MTIRLGHQADEVSVANVYRLPDPGRRISYRLLVDDVDITDDVAELSFGRQGDAEPGIVLEAKLGTRLFGRMKQKAVKVYVTLMDDDRLVEVRRFTGKVLKAPYKDGITDLTGVTGGYWNGLVCLGRTIQFDRASPAESMYKAVLMNTAYDHHYTDIEGIEVPTISRLSDAITETAFGRFDKVGDVLASVGESTDVFHRDNSMNGHNIRRDVGPVGISNFAATFFVGPDIDPEQFEWAATEEEYSSVVVYKEGQEGEPEIIAQADIVDSGAPLNVIYEIPVSPETSDGECWQKAFEAAARFEGGGIYDVKFPLKYIHALTEDGDGITVIQPDEVDGVPLLRHWIMEVRLQRTAFPEGVQEYECKAVIGREEKVPGPAVEVEPPSEINTPAIYETPAGVVNINMDLPWVLGETEQAVIVDLDIADAMGVHFTEFTDYMEVVI